jgi:hypothetical protein
MSIAPQFRKTARISESLHRQLEMYTLAAGAAGVSVLALAGTSEAKVVYTETHQVTSARVPLYIDLNHDGINDFVLRTTYYMGSAYFKVGLSAFGWHNSNNEVAGQRLSHSSYFFSAASAMRAGTLIGPKTGFPVHFPFLAEELFKKDVRTSGYSDLGSWAGKGEGVRNRYLGLKFVIDGKIHYGWARVSVTLGHHRQRDDVIGTLTGYAYETVPNRPIVAGETEGAEVVLVQPGTLGGLARGMK